MIWGETNGNGLSKINKTQKGNIVSRGLEGNIDNMKKLKKINFAIKPPPNPQFRA